MMKATMAESRRCGGAATYTPGSLEFEARVNATFDVWRHELWEGRQPRLTNRG